MELLRKLPDSGVALSHKRQLAISVLRDVKSFSDSFRHRNNNNVGILLSALQNELCLTSITFTGRIVGPEIYRWLAEASWSEKRSQYDVVHQLLDDLVPLLLGRLIAAGVRAGAVSFKYSAEAIRIPIASWVSESVQKSNDEILRCDSRSLNFASHRYDLESLRSHIDGCDPADVRIGSSKIFFHQRGNPLRDVIYELSETASIPVKSDERMYIYTPSELNSKRVEKIRANLTKGFDLIRSISSSHADEIESVTDSVTLVKGNRFVGGSDIWYQGVAILNLDPDWTPITSADHLVHEAAHISLHAANELSPLLMNPHAMGGQSPIRPDPRPVYGILHATFVFMRLVQFFRLMETVDNDEVSFRLHRHLLGFYEGMIELERMAEFTTHGGALFRVMGEVRQEFMSSLPQPDPLYYRRIGNDYII